MLRSFAIAFLSFTFTALAFAAGWALADLKTGLLAGAAMFTVFFTAAVVNLFFVKSYSYADAALPAAVFFYEMLPVNLPGFVDDTFALGAAFAVVLRQAVKEALPALVRELRAGKSERPGAGRPPGP